MTGVPDPRERLRRAATELGLQCTEAQVDLLLSYVAQLQRWNKTYNLTALRTSEQMLIQHVFDSLAVVPHVRAALAREQRPEPLLVDVGSGGGLPGVVLAAFCEGCRVLCVDAVEKKVAFVRQMAAVLGLPGLRAEHARIERMAPLDAAVVISRAFASLLDFARLAGDHVSAEGVLLAMKGRKPLDEIRALEAAGGWRVDRVEPLSVPELQAERCLVWMSHSEGTA